MTINARHRKHYKSGGCKTSILTGDPRLYGTIRWRRLLDAYTEYTRRKRARIDMIKVAEAAAARRALGLEQTRQTSPNLGIFQRAFARVKKTFGFGGKS